jgi:ABC-type branched-subunit amino acid transport system substrate-binding protein
VRAPARLAGLAAVALSLAGCGSELATHRGGVIVGKTLTVYSLLPGDAPRAASVDDLVLGQKLALAEARGTAAGRAVNFVARPLPQGKGGVANAVREAIADPQVIAAIADLDSASARVTVPLLNGAGILHVSPGATYTGFAAPVGSIDPYAPARYAPAGRRTLAPTAPTDAAQAVAIARAARGRVAIEAEPGDAAQALAEAIRRQVGRTVSTEQADTVVYAGSDPVNARGVVEGILGENPRAQVLLDAALAPTDVLTGLPGRRVAVVTPAGPADQDPGFVRAFAERFGRDPGPYALVGYRAMTDVVAAVKRAGPRAGQRQRVIDAYFAAHPAPETAAEPFWLERRRGGRPVYDAL